MIFSIISHFLTVLFFHICSTFLHLISKFGKVTIKGWIQIKQAVQRGTFLDMPEAIDQETSVTHSLVTLPKKTIKAVCARCRKDFILAIFLSMDFYFVSFDRRCSLNRPNLTAQNLYLCQTCICATLAVLVVYA